jgi:hypothetical protein
MTYYDALVAEWATLTGTTAQKLAAINALTITGATPTTAYTTGNAIFNCLVWSEFNALSATQQTLLMQICAIQGPILGGSASPFLAPFFGAIASKAPQTIAALVALAQAIVQPWWQANGYTSPISAGDLAAAGGLT